MQCVPPTLECGGKCVDPAIDRAHCGGCDSACGEGLVCSEGTCGLECSGGTKKCGSKCVRLDSDPENCGGCGTLCDAVADGSGVCVEGQCSYACTTGFADCDTQAKTGCETDTLSDPKNCGGCSLSCFTLANATPKCDAGLCAVESCNKGFADCDMSDPNGCEVNISVDAKNCGACGKTCNPGDICSGGKCGRPVVSSSGGGVCDLSTCAGLDCCCEFGGAVGCVGANMCKAGGGKCL